MKRIWLVLGLWLAAGAGAATTARDWFWAGALAVAAAAAVAVAWRPISAWRRSAAELAAALDSDAEIGIDPTDPLAPVARAAAESLTRARSAAAQAAAARAELVALVESMSDAVLAVGPGGRAEFANSAAGQLLGLAPGEAVGLPALAVHQSLALDDAAARVRSTGRPERLTVSLGGPRVTQCDVMLAPVATDGDRGVVLVARDVSGASRLEQMRSDFVANVSHELQTPLAVIRSAAETLGNSAAADPVTVRRFAGSIESQAVRLSRLVERLLVLSRLESGQQPVSLSPVAVVGVAAEVSSTLATAVADAGQTLTVAVPPDLWARADPDLLHQVLGNLVDNCTRYAGRGAHIDVAARSEGRWVVVSVVDDGVGVPPDQLGRIFERFYTGDRSRSRHGTGLGLAIAKHMVEVMGGRLGASGGPGGHGLRVDVWLAAAGEVAES